jgi:AraC family transcriptional regulator
LPERLEDVGLEMGMAPSRVELRNRFNVADPVLRGIAEQLRRHAAADTSEDPIFLQTALHVLATRLLRRHSVTSPSTQAEGGRLSRKRLHRVERYVHAHLDGDLSLDDLAQEVGLSKYHFARRFKERTGQSPYQFIIYERVRTARRLLRATTRPLAQIALDVGFSSQSHLTRTFKRHVGVPPGQYRTAWR